MNNSASQEQLQELRVSALVSQLISPQSSFLTQKSQQSQISQQQIQSPRNQHIKLQIPSQIQNQNYNTSQITSFDKQVDGQNNGQMYSISKQPYSQNKKKSILITTQISNYQDNKVASCISTDLEIASPQPPQLLNYLLSDQLSPIQKPRSPKSIIRQLTAKSNYPTTCITDRKISPKNQSPIKLQRPKTCSISKKNALKISQTYVINSNNASILSQCRSAQASNTNSMKQIQIAQQQSEVPNYLKSTQSQQAKQEQPLSPHTEKEIQFQKVLDLNNINYQKDMKEVKKQIVNEVIEDIILTEQRSVRALSCQNDMSPSKNKKKMLLNNNTQSCTNLFLKNIEPTFKNIMITTEPMQRFKLLKQYVFQNIQLPKSQYKYLDNGVKDYILRKNGLDIIKQRREEVEKEKSQYAQPEFKNFPKDKQIAADLRSLINIKDKYLEQKLKQQRQKLLEGTTEKQIAEEYCNDNKKIIEEQNQKKLNQIRNEKRRQTKFSSMYQGQGVYYSENSSEKLQDQLIQQIKDMDPSDDNRYADIPPEFLPYTTREKLQQGGYRCCYQNPKIKVDLAKLLPPKQKFTIQDLEKQKEQEQKQKELEQQKLTISIENNQVLFADNNNLSQSKSKTNQLKSSIKLIEDQVQPKEIKGNDHYIKLYNNIHWNKETEQIFTEMRNQTKKNTKQVGSRGIANQLACASLPFRSKSLHNIYKEIKYDIQKEQGPFYFINANHVNVQMIQKELDNINKNDIKQVESEVAKDTLINYNRIKNYVKKIRSDYFHQISESIRHEYDMQRIKQEMDLKLEKKRQEHQYLQKKIRLVLFMDKKKKQKITMTDKNFDKQKFFENKLSQLDNFCQIKKNMTLFKQQEIDDKIDLRNFESRGIRDISTRKLNKKEETFIKKYKCSSFYSGGPQQHYKPTKYQLNKAALIIQTAVRKYLTQRKVQILMDKRIEYMNLVKKQESLAIERHKSSLII